MRYCEISAKRKDSDHHDIIDLTAFNTDGFDVTGHKTLGESALFAGCPILRASAYYFAGFDILMNSFTGKNVWIHDCTVWAQDDCIAVKVKKKLSANICDHVLAGWVREHVV